MIHINHIILGGALVNILLLEGKTAIVTGGSKGIGKAIVDLYVKEGANVVMTARGKAALDATAEEINAKGYPGKVIGVVADASSEEDGKRVFQTAIENFGQVDIMCNNAGISKNNSLESTTNEMWDQIMDINLKGPMIYMRLCLEHMLPKKSGCIVNISSISGVRPTSGAAYTTSKAALNALTQNVAFRCVDEGIRLNSICPSRVATEMVTNVVKEAADTGATIMHPFTDRYIYRDCRPITTEGIATVALFLASDYLSGDVTGQTITVDGGSYMPCR